MKLRLVVPVLWVCLWLCRFGASQEALSAPSAHSVAANVQDFSKTVLPISEVKMRGFGVSAGLGTGFCLDPECRFIVTNYHVVALAEPRRIKQEKVKRRYLATGPDDEGATMNRGPDVPGMEFARSRDLAILQLGNRLPHYSGIPFSGDDPEIGDSVGIYCFPKQGMGPLRNLAEFRGTFKGETPDGLLAYDYVAEGGRRIGPGCSGGLVVEHRTHRAVGVLSAIAEDGQATALAVPIRVLAEFVRKVQPCLAQKIFPRATGGLLDASEDVYPRFAPARDQSVQFRPDEAAEIKLLRSKAQFLADSIRGLIAVQTFSWGSGVRQPFAEQAYEVLVTDRLYQRFREYPDGKEWLEGSAEPRTNHDWMSTAAEWFELPEFVGTEMQIKIAQMPDATVNNQRIKVFQWEVAAEDEMCRFQSMEDFGFFKISNTKVVGCYGEVWTDAQTNILTISRNLDLAGRWHNHRVQINYGWVPLQGGALLLPLTISGRAQLHDKEVWCRGEFTNHRKYESTVRMQLKDAVAVGSSDLQ